MPSPTRTPWAIRCYGIDPEMGAGPCTKDLVYLTKEEYMRQMNVPSRTWRCPRCGGDAMWDDANYEDAIDRGDHV